MTLHHSSLSRTFKQDDGPVIIIEDCEEDAAIICDGLQRHATAYTVTHFNDSYAARDWIGAALQPARLILLDLNLPGETGNSLLQTLKSHPRHRTTPVVILSSSDDPRDVAGCYHSGANSYHTKPLDVEKFYQTVQDIAEYWLQSAHFIKA